MARLMAGLLVVAALAFAGPARAQEKKLTWERVEQTGDLVLFHAFGVPQTGSCQTVAAAANTSARNGTALPANTFVKIWCDVSTFFHLGDGTVVSATTREPLTAEQPEYFPMGANTHIAFINATAAWSCRVCPRAPPAKP